MSVDNLWRTKNDPILTDAEADFVIITSSTFTAAARRLGDCGIQHDFDEVECRRLTHRKLFQSKCTSRFARAS